MKKRPAPPDPMIFKKHEPKHRGITVFDRHGNRMTRHGAKDFTDPHRDQQMLYVKGG